MASRPHGQPRCLRHRQTITGNVTGTLLFTRGLMPLLEKSGAGDIVNIVSISGIHNMPLQGASVAYIASKHGQAGLTDALRQELRGRPVRVTRNLSTQHQGYFAARCRSLERDAARNLMAHQSRHC